jgi:dTDP-4-amino-4,6-dideoxygalactose transaminase
VTASLAGADGRRTEAPPIGGVFELDLAAVLAARDAPARFPEAQAVTSGRTALAILAEEAPGPWLLPAYLCESVLQPLRQAGIPFDFYPVGGDFRPRLDELERSVESQSPAAVLVVDYFGFPPSVDDAARLGALREACLVVEDCVQGSLVELPDAAGGAIGNAVFTSFRKYLPVPDGGLLTGVTPRRLPPAAASLRERLLGQLLRGAWVSGLAEGPQVEAVFLALLEAGEASLDEELPLEATSRLSERLIAGLDLAEAALRRRANFVGLSEALEGSEAVTPILRELPAGVSPLAFPVRVGGGRRDTLRAELVRRQIFCPVHWPLPPEIDAGRFPEEHRLSAEMLGLPLDQRYEPADMHRLADELAAAWRASS